MGGTISVNMDGKSPYNVGGGDEGYINADVCFTMSADDISTSGSTLAASPVTGKIKKIYSCIQNAITTANANLTFEIGGVAVTGGAIEIGHDGSAAGDVDTATPTAANTITAGQAIECVSDGGSSTSCKCELTFVINQTA